MYIAFKWLVSLTLVMWLAMCFTNIYLKESKKISCPGLYHKSIVTTFKNVSEPIDSISAAEGTIHYLNSNEHSIAVLHLMMFVAGAFAVSVLNKKQEIIRCIRRNIAKIDIQHTFKKYIKKFKNPALNFGVTVTKCFDYFWGKLKTYGQKLIEYINYNALKTTQSLKQRHLYLTMVNKVKEIGIERKNLGQLLMSTIQENKNIKIQYQLETMAKKRLSLHLENTNKQMKENRSRYVNFQHLYLATHQENIFLKARIRKLTKEKEDIEKNLMGLINVVYKSKNIELKTYCSRFIVTSRDNLLNCDMSAEIQKFLKKTHSSRFSSSCNLKRSRAKEITCARSWPSCAGTRVSEILQDDNLVPLISDSPKLKGLPGEYVWTVKDKDGIIEKLYEYDYESEFDNGDTIRKIRQYSVYYDKDCLLDFINSIQELDINIDTAGVHSHDLNVEYPLESRRIVSGSDAFKKFMRNSKSIMPSPNISINQ